ncbi:PaaI family thioesterase [Nocardia carnea]|uniref:PaaI family thioesterase n=1 Tax=Nocardia TaxID=1817 RepID=UPI00245717A6|nr:PaaI family thioesterase [Nocardia carnea]
MSEPSFEDSFRRLLGGRPDMAVTLGLAPVRGDDHEVVLSMEWRPELAQPTGVFSAASLFGLADIAGTFLAMRYVREGFPLAITSSVHLLGNTRSGTALATARLIKAGRTVIRTDTMVTAGDVDLASVQTTYLNPS